MYNQLSINWLKQFSSQRRLSQICCHYLSRHTTITQRQTPRMTPTSDLSIHRTTTDRCNSIGRHTYHTGCYYGSGRICVESQHTDSNWLGTRSSTTLFNHNVTPAGITSRPPNRANNRMDIRYYGLDRICAESSNAGTTSRPDPSSSASISAAAGGAATATSQSTSTNTTPETVSVQSAANAASPTTDIEFDELAHAIQLQQDQAVATFQSAKELLTRPDSDSSPLVVAISESLEWLHLTTGLPWWGTFFAAGLIARILLIPFQYYNGRQSAGLAGIQPLLVQLTSAIQLRNKKEEINRAQDQTNLSMKLLTPAQFESNRKDNQTNLSKLTWGLIRIQWRYGYHRVKSFVAPIVQIGCLILLSSSIREMAPLVPSLRTGGAYWFTDLTVPDPTWILPIAALSCSYFSSLLLDPHYNKNTERLKEKVKAAVIEIHQNVFKNDVYVKKQLEHQKTQKLPPPPSAFYSKKKSNPTVPVTTITTNEPSTTTPPPDYTIDVSPIGILGTIRSMFRYHVGDSKNFRHLMRGVAIFAIPWVIDAPAGIFFYWFAGTIWQHITTLLLFQPGVRRALGYDRLEELWRTQPPPLKEVNKRRAIIGLIGLATMGGAWMVYDQWKQGRTKTATTATTEPIDSSTATTSPANVASAEKQESDPKQ